jgi:CO dehydrogenase nickel-insertion accessory protein CooC1
VRVRISYGAHIDEVPEEIDQMFTYVSQKSRSVMKQVETIEELFEEEDLETIVTVINKLRLTLKSIDLRLADVEMISQGYLTHLEGDKNVPDRRPSLDSAGISDAITNP